MGICVADVVGVADVLGMTVGMGSESIASSIVPTDLLVPFITAAAAAIAVFLRSAAASFLPLCSNLYAVNKHNTIDAFTISICT